MKVVIIGAGNVATVFGRLIKKNGHEIIQVISRNETTGKILSDELGCTYTDQLSAINLSADIYITAIADAGLYEIKETLNLSSKLIVHTAGAVPIDVLKDVSENYGVLYPLQSLRKENTGTVIEIPLLTEGNNEQSSAAIESFAKTLSGTVTRTTDEERLKLHVAAVVVNNFTNYLFTLAADYCKDERLDFKLLQPLIEETAMWLRNNLPNNVQTGPAIRKDVVTLDKHLRILSGHPKLRTIYLRLTDSIMNPE